jgi:hypothetical protein
MTVIYKILKFRNYIKTMSGTVPEAGGFLTQWPRVVTLGTDDYILALLTPEWVKKLQKE